LAGLAEVAKVAPLDAMRLKRDLQAQAADVRRLLGRHVPQARQMLRKVLVGRLEVTRIEQDERKGYCVEGKGSYVPLLAGEAAATTSGVPRGIFSKYIPLDPLQHLGMTIRLEGRVAA
jgi:hypothetical protein